MIPDWGSNLPGAQPKKKVLCQQMLLWAFPDDSDGKESTCNVGDLGLIPGLGRSPGGGYGNPLQYSCLENPMNRGAWWATAQAVPKSQTRLSDYTQHIVMCIKISCSLFITHVANKDAQFLHDGVVTF